MSSKHACAVVAFACISGTLVVLFGHIRSIDDLTLTHLYIALGLAVTLAAGHFMWEENTTWAKCFAFTLLWLVGTVLCVGLSGGRSSAILERNTLAATQENSTSSSLADDAKRDRDDAKKKADAAELTAVDKEEAQALACKGGTGPLCKGATFTAEQARQRATTALEAYNKASANYHATISKKKAPTVSNAELRPFARLYALMRGIAEEQALETVTTFVPYLFALLTEFGAIVFFHHASIRTLPISAPPAEPEHAAEPTSPSAEPSRAIVEAQITLSSICKDMGIDARTARKQLRILSIPRPAHGWAWTTTDAEQIKSRLSTIN